MKLIKVFIFLISSNIAFSQNNWPSTSWSNSINLTSTMASSSVDEASGLYWNKDTNRLYLVQNSGRVRVLQYNATTNSFSQIGNKSISGGPEGITMANNSENAFYTIDENNYEIRKYTHTTDFSTVTKTKSWNLLASPSTMTDTGNTGPEGICFIPDSYLTSSNFISQVTGLPYVSQKGMGGLFFVAHQDAGYIWVFDVNANTNDDFAFIGKYKTNREESCDLSFDASTGLLYILHNIDGNLLEATALSSTVAGSNRKLNMVNEYFLPVPSGNTNIEGFAITEKCSQGNTVSAWLCRDASSSESSSILTDTLRWFSPFSSDGNCLPLSNNTTEIEENLVVFPNPATSKITIQELENSNSEITIYSALGTIMYSEKTTKSIYDIDISNFSSGIYFVILKDGTMIKKSRFIKI